MDALWFNTCLLVYLVVPYAYIIYIAKITSQQNIYAEIDFCHNTRKHITVVQQFWLKPKDYVYSYNEKYFFFFFFPFEH